MVCERRPNPEARTPFPRPGTNLESKPALRIPGLAGGRAEEQPPGFLAWWSQREPPPRPHLSSTRTRAAMPQTSHRGPPEGNAGQHWLAPSAPREPFGASGPDFPKAQVGRGGGLLAKSPSPRCLRSAPFRVPFGERMSLGHVQSAPPSPSGACPRPWPRPLECSSKPSVTRLLLGGRVPGSAPTRWRGSAPHLQGKLSAGDRCYARRLFAGDQRALLPARADDILLKRQAVPWNTCSHAERAASPLGSISQWGKRLSLSPALFSTRGILKIDSPDEQRLLLGPTHREGP